MHSLKLGLAVATVLTFASPAGHAAAGHAHQHGTVRLEVAIEGGQLQLALHAPLDSLLGFERAPRTAAERTAADTLLQQMRDAGRFFVPDAAAGCVAGPAEVQAAVLDPQAPRTKGEHAELEASVAFRCERPAQLQRLRVTLFEAYPRIKRIDVQSVTPAGQGKAVLRAASPVLALAP